MAEVIDSLMVRLGLETDAEQFREAESQFAGLQSQVLQFGAIIGAGFGLQDMTFGFSEATKEVSDLAETLQGLGVTPQLVDNLRGAFALATEDVSEADSLLRNMAGLIEDTDWGEISDQAFARGFDVSGIQDAENMTEAIAALNEQMREVDDQERARRIADKLGLSDAQFRMLRGHDLGAEMDRAAEFSPMSGEMTESAREFNEGWAELSQAMEGLQNEISASFVGDWGETLEEIAGLIKENRDEIAQFADDAKPYLRNTAAALGTLVAINVARSSLGIFKNFPLLTTGAALGGTWLWENSGGNAGPPSGEETTDEQSSNRSLMDVMPEDLSVQEQREFMQGDRETRIEIMVDARSAENPETAEKVLRRAAEKTLQELSENTVRDTESDVE